MSATARAEHPPSHCDLLIAGSRILDLTASSGVRDGMAIAVAGPAIAAIGPQADIEAAWVPDRRLDLDGHVVTSGFVDAHVHLGGFLGAARPYVPATGLGPFSGSALDEGVLRMVAQFCSMPVPADIVAAVVRPALAAMLRAGFTGVVDAGGPGVEGVAEAAAELGIRASIGPSLADQWHDETTGKLSRQADASALLRTAEQFVDAHDGLGGGRVRALVSAVEPMGCSDELLAGIAEVTQKRQLPTHVHSHITGDSVRGHEEAFGRSATERLAEARLLNDRCTIMHAGSLTDHDIGAFAAAGVAVNHNPTGNALYGFGIAQGRSVPRLLDAGVPVVLGSDYTPSVANPFELIRAALMLHREVAASDFVVTLEQALAMATNGAAPLGRPGELGRVAVGQLADLVIIDTRGSHHLASDHPIPAVALHARVDDVTTVIVDGRIVIDEGRLVEHDEATMLHDARVALRTIAEHP